MWLANAGSVRLLEDEEGRPIDPKSENPRHPTPRRIWRLSDFIELTEQEKKAQEAMQQKRESQEAAAAFAQLKGMIAAVNAKKREAAASQTCRAGARAMPSPNGK